MKTLSLVLALALHCANLVATDVKTVEKVDLEKYLGLWNELYRVPNSFQDNTSSSKSKCFDTTAEYGVSGEGKISVTNTCHRVIDGKTEADIARAVADVIEGSGGAKLVVNFTGIAVLRWLGIGNGDYWVLGLGPVNSDKKYSWAIVGSPSRKYGWILSRKPSLTDAEREEIFKILEANDYERSQFEFTRRK